jgi:dTMP kinase
MKSRQPLTFYGEPLPGVDISELRGKLIVIEGPDSIGRSTQVRQLRFWLEQQGYAVMDTGMARSALTRKGIQDAKTGHTLGPLTMTLFYTTDFADRLENEIVPALRAGFVVVTDRYTYSLMARALVRGMDSAWVRNLYAFALKPDAVFYLRIAVESLIPRVVFSHGFDYWESGMDLHANEDMYDSFCKYQSALMAQFDGLTEQYGFEVVDASQPVEQVFRDLRDGIRRVMEEGIQPTAPIPIRKPPDGTTAEEAAARIPAGQARGGGKAGD